MYISILNLFDLLKISELFDLFRVSRTLDDVLRFPLVYRS